MRRSLVQEVAHHVEMFIPGIKEVIATAWANPSKRPITAYAAQHSGEYFAESLAAYVVERDALIVYDGVGSRMVEQAVVRMGSTE